MTKVGLDWQRAHLEVDTVGHVTQASPRVAQLEVGTAGHMTEGLPHVSNAAEGRALNLFRNVCVLKEGMT